MKAVEDKFNMLVYTAELMYSQDVKSTKRIGKVMALYSKLFRAVDAQKKDTHEKNKFLMGSLYALGGLLKIEAKSYLMTNNEMDKKPEGFKLVCPLSNPENPVDEAEAKYLRKLKEDDLEFFNKEFFFVVRQFIRSIANGLDNTMTEDGVELMLKLTNEDFYDDMKELERNEPERLDKTLASHFVTKFLLDVIQFCFTFFVKA